MRIPSIALATVSLCSVVLAQQPGKLPFIVTFKDSVSAAVLAQHGVTQDGAIFGAEAVTATVSAATAAKLRQHPEIETVEIDHVASAFGPGNGGGPGGGGPGNGGGGGGGGGVGGQGGMAGGSGGASIGILVSGIPYVLIEGNTVISANGGGGAAGATVVVATAATAAEVRLAATRVAEAVAMVVKVVKVARAVPVVVAPLIAFSLAQTWHPTLLRTPCRRVLEVRRLLVPQRMVVPGAEDGAALVTAVARVQLGIIPL